MLKRTIFTSLILLLLLTISTSLSLADMPDMPEVDWWAEYYNNNALQGEPVKMLHEPMINHDWGYKSPLDGFPWDNFSTRWSAQVPFEAGDYTFSVTADDGVRVWVDGDLIIDQWRTQAVTTFIAKKYLSQGDHTIQVAYYEASGAAVIKFWWRQDRMGTPVPTPTPTATPAPHHPPVKKRHPIVVDNLDENFIWGGTSKHRQSGYGGHGNSFYWTQNTVYQPENYAKWVPYFARGGRYEVYVFVPDNHATTTNLRYRVFHNNERHDVTINQAWYYDQWVSLGTYTFDGHNHGKEYVIVYDNTHEGYASTTIAFDAIKFVPR